MSALRKIVVLFSDYLGRPKVLKVVSIKKIQTIRPTSDSDNVDTLDPFWWLNPE